MTTATEWAPQYDHNEVEKGWYERWEQASYFRADDTSDKPPFCIVIPPPNVTGALHMGHALFVTLQDILTRWHRMLGDNALWLPGTDHAGIATHMVVERKLWEEEKITRHDLGREGFVERVWEWKEEHGGRITEQMRVMGASCDWDRERFTMDEGLCSAVVEAFVRLYEEGLIYRANRLINWCPRCHTALSDLEVEHDEGHQGHLWDIAYPVTGTDRHLVVSTTRPETMLGDTAVAVHPDDERYADLVGQTVTLPLMDREIPIIADEILVDKEFGSGAVKVTSAHDFNDFETGVRHSLEMISILDEDGVANENAGEYQGLDRFEAREKIVSDLESLGLMRGVKDHAHPLAACQRCETVVEPRLSLQWFVDIKSLASSAIDAVVNGDTVIRPESWTKTYLNWMNNIEDWCISRQLWWGHQIPAWFCQACNEITVARDEPLACGSCGSANIERDPDVLDTWFSSGLWPFSTMGWPDTESNDALNTFYPTAVMETGYDILFLWVSRMMILGLHFMDEVPFKEVYLHGMVCAADGQKMSKVKGNIIDPLDVVEEIGADALRFSMAAATGQGHVVRADQERMMGYRNFINKIWNAARFALPHVQELEPREFDADTLDLSSADRWLLSRLSRTVESVNCELAEFRFSDAALTIYHFFWHELCDWYLELIKPQLFGEDSPKSEATKRTLVHALDVSLRVLHPFAPFITEEIWQKLPIPHDAESIMISPFPTGDKALIDENAESQISLVQEVIAGIRNVRAEMNVPPGKHAPALIRTSGAHLDALNCLSDYLTDLAKIESLTIGANVEKPAHSGTVVIGDMTEVYVPLEGLIDVDQERARLSKELGKQEKYVTGLKKKLSNEQFLSKAPPEVVDAEREKLTAGVGQQDRLRRNLDALTA